MVERVLGMFKQKGQGREFNSRQGLIFLKMIAGISQHLKSLINSFREDDSLLFNERIIKIDKNNFFPISSVRESRTIAFVDGGQAEILSAGNFCLSFIRVGALIFQDNKKLNELKQEFYLLTTAKYQNGDIFYQSKIFGNKIIDEQDLQISSFDATIKNGLDRAAITQVSTIARRFAELALAGKAEADFVVLDGILEPRYRNEEKYLGRISNLCSLAKTSSLFTVSGNSPAVLLSKIAPTGCWGYFAAGESYFVKLHDQSRHIFRFMGDKKALPLLLENSIDALFLGYPYGLIAVDRLARVSNEEKQALRLKFLLSAENKEIAQYLSTTNAHEILDNLG